MLQHRESIAQDQEKTESLKSQMQELEGSIQDVDAKIHHAESMLKDLRKLKDQISTKTVERSTLLKEQHKQYAALAEENEGLNMPGKACSSVTRFGLLLLLCHWLSTCISSEGRCYLYGIF